MEIKTKFNLNDFVYPIQKSGYHKKMKCETCNGKGSVTINNTDRNVSCPDCFSGYITEYILEEWRICHDSSSRIGKIDVELYSKPKQGKDRFAYMLQATGVGSGTVWYEGDLFSSLDEAKNECEVRNQLEPANG